MSLYGRIVYVLTTQTIRAERLKIGGAIVTNAGDIDSFTWVAETLDGVVDDSGNMAAIDSGATWEATYTGPATAQEIVIKLEAISGTHRGRWTIPVRFDDF